MISHSLEKIHWAIKGHQGVELTFPDILKHTTLVPLICSRVLDPLWGLFYISCPKCEDIVRHLLTTVFKVSSSWAGARIMGKYETAVYSGSTNDINWLNTVQEGLVSESWRHRKKASAAASVRFMNSLPSSDFLTYASLTRIVNTNSLVFGVVWTRCSSSRMVGTTRVCVMNCWSSWSAASVVWPCCLSYTPPHVVTGSR